MKFGSNAFAPELKLEKMFQNFSFQAESTLIFSLNGLVVLVATFSLLFIFSSSASGVPPSAWADNWARQNFVVFPTIGCCFSFFLIMSTLF